MIEIPDLRAFVRIAELRNISASARALGAPKSTVSRSLIRLEEGLGIALVERSTRNLHLTDAGKLFHMHALRILADVDEAQAAVGNLSGVPCGTLRINGPHTFLQGAVAAMLPSFLTRYPKVNVVLEGESLRLDPPATEADIMIRVGPLADSAMVARRLMTVELWTCASPAYLATHGSPSRVADLARHDVVGLVEHRMHWSFHDLGRAPGGGRAASQGGGPRHGRDPGDAVRWRGHRATSRLHGPRCDRARRTDPRSVGHASGNLGSLHRLPEPSRLGGQSAGVHRRVDRARGPVDGVHRPNPRADPGSAPLVGTRER